jgi:hypothetical protein
MFNYFQEKPVNEIKVRQVHEARTQGTSVPCAHLAATEVYLNSRIIASEFIFKYLIPFGISY